MVSKIVKQESIMAGKTMDQILNDMSKKQRKTLTQKLVEGISKVFTVKYTGKYYFASVGFRTNINDIIELVSRAKKTDGYITRTSNNILQNSLKTGYYFDGIKDNFAKKIETKFINLLFRSGYVPRTFLRESLKNLIDYSNLFIVKIRKEGKGSNEVLHQLVIMPSFGWTVKETLGAKVVTWEFDNGTSTTEYDTDDIIHITYNKESHEVFGTPIVMSTLEDVQILREVESRAIEDYFDSVLKKTVFQVGSKDMPATDGQLKEMRQYIASISPEQDLVINGIVTPSILQPRYTDPSVVLENSKQRVLTGLQSSATQMGMTGKSGRQDAETHQTNTFTSVQDFQENLEDGFNMFIIRDLILEETNKEVNYDSWVEFRFNQTFDDQERKEKHYTHLFVQGMIDHSQACKFIGINPEEFNQKLSYTEMYGKNEQAGSAVSQSNPSNQYGSTGTTKKTKKDETETV